MKTFINIICIFLSIYCQNGPCVQAQVDELEDTINLARIDYGGLEVGSASQYHPTIIQKRATHRHKKALTSRHTRSRGVKYLDMNHQASRDVYVHKRKPKSIQRHKQRAAYSLYDPAPQNFKFVYEKKQPEAAQEAAASYQVLNGAAMPSIDLRQNPQAPIPFNAYFGDQGFQSPDLSSFYQQPQALTAQESQPPQFIQMPYQQSEMLPQPEKLQQPAPTHKPQSYQEVQYYLEPTKKPKRMRVKAKPVHGMKEQPRKVNHKLEQTQHSYSFVDFKPSAELTTKKPAKSGQTEEPLVISYRDKSHTKKERYYGPAQFSFEDAKADPMLKVEVPSGPFKYSLGTLQQPRQEIVPIYESHHTEEKHEAASNQKHESYHEATQKHYDNIRENLESPEDETAQTQAQKFVQLPEPHYLRISKHKHAQLKPVTEDADHLPQPEKLVQAPKFKYLQQPQETQYSQPEKPVQKPHYMRQSAKQPTKPAGASYVDFNKVHSPVKPVYLKHQEEPPMPRPSSQQYRTIQPVYENQMSAHYSPEQQQPKSEAQEYRQPQSYRQLITHEQQKVEYQQHPKTHKKPHKGKTSNQDTDYRQHTQPQSYLEYAQDNQEHQQQHKKPHKPKTSNQDIDYRQRTQPQSYLEYAQDNQEHHQQPKSEYYYQDSTQNHHVQEEQYSAPDHSSHKPEKIVSSDHAPPTESLHFQPMTQEYKHLISNVNPPQKLVATEPPKSKPKKHTKIIKSNSHKPVEVVSKEEPPKEAPKKKQAVKVSEYQVSISHDNWSRKNQAVKEVKPTQPPAVEFEEEYEDDERQGIEE